MRIAVITASPRSGEVGGAEALYDGLVGALRARREHQVERLDVPVDETSMDGILAAYLRCHDLDLAGFDLVISTKAPTYLVRHPRHVSYLVHTMRVFYDMFAREHGAGTDEQRRHRALVQFLDAQALMPPRVRRHCAVGRTTFERLYEADPRFRSVPVTILHHPPRLDGYLAPRAGEHILVPGRLHAWKRIDLVLEAFRRVKADVPLKIVGRGEEEPALRALARRDPRVELLGHVSDEALLDLYARAIVVPFVPMREDFGLVTVEAFRARKPVLTCTDSGEPLRFVRELETGAVCRPDPDEIAAKLELLLRERDLAAELGERGHAAVAHLSWERVVDGLLAGEAERPRVRSVSRAARSGRTLRALVVDNQPITPATGGGRLRLLGLYGTLTDGVVAEYVGTYDWPGEPPRDQRLTPALRETTVPLSREHFTLEAALRALAPDRTIADVAMPWLAWTSRALLDELHRRLDDADVVVLSHPWMYPAIREAVRRAGKPVIYDSHNCEALLREALLGGSPLGDALAGHARFVEGLLCQEAARVLACSEEDAAAFARLYGVPEARLRVVPNGTFVERFAARRPRPAGAPLTACFVGSGYAPNVEAARFIVERLAPAVPEVGFVVAGGAGDALRGAAHAANVRLLGGISDEELAATLAAADLALNPMSRGSGVNIKMLDYLAAGLPAVTTPVGARGLDAAAEALVVAELDDFAAALRALAADPARRERLGAAGRRIAVERFDWRSISRELGELLLEVAAEARGAAPLFSVIVPTYERAESLRALLAALDRQTLRELEVIVVDQSATPVEVGPWRHGYPVRVLHTSERGAVKARNLGLRHARGRVVAFTDDDCRPEPTWLEHARRYFADPGVAGVEGLVKSDRHDRERWRVVSNEGSSGGLFMTANLLLRREVLESLGGFDERFEHPHYREDTDLGWRALAYGRIPFARDVAVVHPAHDKRVARESDAERSRFFVHDPLLYFKHPRRYVELMRVERHHVDIPEFWTRFEEGIARHEVPVSMETLRAALL